MLTGVELEVIVAVVQSTKFLPLKFRELSIRLLILKLLGFNLFLCIYAFSDSLLSFCNL